MFLPSQQRLPLNSRWQWERCSYAFQLNVLQQTYKLHRFYFVGDEDLLEIIGNSKNVARLQKHFKKMFAGIAAIILNEDNTIINGIASREGEEVSSLLSFH